MTFSRCFRSAVVLFASCFLFVAAAVAQTAGAENTKDAHAEGVAKWRQLRFGMFVHWGPVSLKGTEIGASRGESVPIEEYDNLYKRFNPLKFNADEWVKVAQEAGMKYVVLTAKHHDGFCLWDTKQNDYNIMRSPFGRDVVKELSEACRKQGIAFGTYYSVCDLWHPDYPLGSPGGRSHKPNPNLDRYEQYLCKQLDELIGNYGPLATIWFDMPAGFDAARGRRAIEFVHSRQPSILVNSRCLNPGDYDTVEDLVGKMQTDRPWETCLPICRQWAWKPNDDLRSLKECLQTLVKVVCGDGNFLLNTGPMPDGRIEPRQADRLREMGRWLAKYGESIYDTRGGPFQRADWVGATYKDNTIYLHLLDPNMDTVTLPPIQKKIVDHSVLTGGTATVKQTAKSIEVSVPKANRQEIDTIVVLKLDGPAAEIKF